MPSETKSRCSPPKDLHVLNPKRFLNTDFAGEISPDPGDSYCTLKPALTLHLLSEFSYRKILPQVHLSFCFTRSFRIGKTSFHLMFSCENISFVLRTHHCSFALQTHRCSVTVTRKHSRSLSYVEIHQQSTRFQEVRMNNRKERPFLLGVIEGILSTYMFTFTFSIFLRKNLSFM